MSKNISVESSTPSTPNPSINPALQAALGSLDVQLEEELARYRRQRSGRPVMPPRGLGRHQTRKPIELIPVDRANEKTQRPALGMSTAPEMSFPLALVNPTPTAEPQEETNRELLARSHQLEAPLSATSESADVPSVPSPTRAAVDRLATEESVSENPPEKPLEQGDDLAAFAQERAQPEDYLESSEQLLRSLDREETETPRQKGLLDKLLTPLGVGSIALLLVAGATVAYILNNSSMGTQVRDRLFGSKTQTATQSPTQTTTANNDSAAEDSSSVDSPNLASEEFPEVNLNTLSNLEASPTPTPPVSQIPEVAELPESEGTSSESSAAPNPAIPGRSSDLSPSLLPPSQQPGTVPPVASPVAPVPIAPQDNPNSAAATTPEASAPSEQVAEAPPPGDNFYYVLINDASAGTLEQARKAVPDAYLREFPEGKRIQMGAFKLEPEAKALVEQLQQQGVSASVYRSPVLK